jgi:hypothetical protein
MKRSLLTGCLAAAVMMSGLMTISANAAPVTPVPLALIASDTGLLPSNVNYRGRHHHRHGFGLYLGAPSFGPRCWWSHRWHRRVCEFY